jgi:hypothetical protein
LDWFICCLGFQGLLAWLPFFLDYFSLQLIGYWTIILIDANYTSTGPYFPSCLSADPLICADILTQMIFVALLLIFHLSFFHIHFLCRIFLCFHNIVTSHFLHFLFLNLSLFFDFSISQPLATNPLAVFARYYSIAALKDFIDSPLSW